MLVWARWKKIGTVVFTATSLPLCYISSCFPSALPKSYYSYSTYHSFWLLPLHTFLNPFCILIQQRTILLALDLELQSKSWTSFTTLTRRRAPVTNIYLRNLPRLLDILLTWTRQQVPLIGFCLSTLCNRHSSLSIYIALGNMIFDHPHDHFDHQQSHAEPDEPRRPRFSPRRSITDPEHRFLPPPPIINPLLNNNGEYGPRHSVNPLLSKNDDYGGARHSVNPLLSSNNDEYPRHSTNPLLSSNHDEHGALLSSNNDYGPHHSTNPLLSNNDEYRSHHSVNPLLSSNDGFGPHHSHVNPLIVSSTMQTPQTSYHYSSSNHHRSPHALHDMAPHAHHNMYPHRSHDAFSRDQHDLLPLRPLEVPSNQQQGYRLPDTPVRPYGWDDLEALPAIMQPSHSPNDRPFFTLPGPSRAMSSTQVFGGYAGGDRYGQYPSPFMNLEPSPYSNNNTQFGPRSFHSNDSPGFGSRSFLPINNSDPAPRSFQPSDTPDSGSRSFQPINTPDSEPRTVPTDAHVGARMLTPFDEFINADTPEAVEQDHEEGSNDNPSVHSANAEATSALSSLSTMATPSFMADASDNSDKGIAIKAEKRDKKGKILALINGPHHDYDILQRPQRRPKNMDSKLQKRLAMKRGPVGDNRQLMGIFRRVNEIYGWWRERGDHKERKSSSHSCLPTLLLQLTLS